MRVEIYCSQDLDKNHFNQLASSKEEIQSKFPDDQISWEPLEGAVASRVAVYRSYDKAQVVQDNRETRAFCLDRTESHDPKRHC
jgi:Domain of unknown function (DUF4268)